MNPYYEDLIRDLKIKMPGNWIYNIYSDTSLIERGACAFASLRCKAYSLYVYGESNNLKSINFDCYDDEDGTSGLFGTQCDLNEAIIFYKKHAILKNFK